MHLYIDNRIILRSTSLTPILPHKEAHTCTSQAHTQINPFGHHTHAHAQTRADRIRPALPGAALLVTHRCKQGCAHRLPYTNTKRPWNLSAACAQIPPSRPKSRLHRREETSSSACDPGGATSTCSDGPSRLHLYSLPPSPPLPTRRRGSPLVAGLKLAQRPRELSGAGRPPLAGRRKPQP